MEFAQHLFYAEICWRSWAKSRRRPDSGDAAHCAGCCWRAKSVVTLEHAGVTACLSGRLSFAALGVFYFQGLIARFVTGGWLRQSERFVGLPDREDQMQKLLHAVPQGHVATFAQSPLPSVQRANDRVVQDGALGRVPQTPTNQVASLATHEHRARGHRAAEFVHAGGVLFGKNPEVIDDRAAVSESGRCSTILATRRRPFACRCPGWSRSSDAIPVASRRRPLAASDCNSLWFFGSAGPTGPIGGSSPLQLVLRGWPPVCRAVA